jgi:hypothetical protein
MAARKREIGQLQHHRDKIQTTQLINRLQKHAFAEVDADGNILDAYARMTPTQIKAAEILLRKAVPDIAAMQINTEVQHNHVVRLPLVAKSTDEWMKQVAEASPDTQPELIELKPNPQEDNA